MSGTDGLDSGLVGIVVLVAAAGTAAMWRILAGMVDHATRLHDTQVKVALLQIRYLERAKAFRESNGAGAAEFVVGEAGEDDVVMT